MNITKIAMVIAAIVLILLTPAQLLDASTDTSVTNSDNLLSSHIYSADISNPSYQEWKTPAFNEALIPYTISTDSQGNTSRITTNSLIGMCDEEKVFFRIESDYIEQSSLSVWLSFISLDSNGNIIDNSIDNPNVASISLFYGVDNQQSLEPSSGDGISSPFIINDLQSGIDYMVMIYIGYSSTRTIIDAYSFNSTITFEARPSSNTYEGNLITSIQNTSNLIQLVESENTFNGVTITEGDGTHSILEMESDDSVLKDINWTGDAGVIAENGNSNNAFTSSKEFTTVEFDTTDDSSFYIYIYMSTDKKCTFILKIDNTIAKTQADGLTVVESGYIGIKNNEVVFSKTLDTKELKSFSGVTEVSIKGKNNTGASNNHYARLYILFPTNQTNTSSLSQISETYSSNSNYLIDNKLSSESSIDGFNFTEEDLGFYSVQPSFFSDEISSFLEEGNAGSHTDPPSITAYMLYPADQSSEYMAYDESTGTINSIITKEPIESSPSNDGM